MAELFSRKAIAESSSGLYVADTKPSSTLGSQCPKKNGKTDAPVRIKQESLLFNLPAELRLRIYDLLLVSRPKPWDNSSGSVRKNHQNSVWLEQPDTMLARESRTMHPAILRTCKRIYLEAVPTLYSRNTISFDNPDLMLRLIDRAGRINTKLIQSLNIYVPPNSDKASWLNLLHALATVATGMRSVAVIWQPNFHLLRRPSARTLAKDIAFAQALARLSKVGVEKLRIEGGYAKPWPAYFRDKFGARVVEAEEDWVEPPSRDTADAEKRCWPCSYWGWIRAYYWGTELLNPWEEEA